MFSTEAQSSHQKPPHRVEVRYMPPTQGLTRSHGDSNGTSPSQAGPLGSADAALPFRLPGKTWIRIGTGQATTFLPFSRQR